MPKIGQELNLNLNAPVLKRTRTSYDENNNTVEYTECFYHGEKYRYYVGNTRLMVPALGEYLRAGFSNGTTDIQESIHGF